MGSDNNNLDLEASSLSRDIEAASGLAHNPVSDFEDNKRSMLQRSLASANTLLEAPNLNQQNNAPANAIFYAETLSRPSSTPVQNPAVRPTKEHEARPVAQQQEEVENEEENLTGWGRIGSGFASLWKACGVLAKKAWNADWKAAAKSCANAVYNLSCLAAKGIKYAVTHPQEAFGFAISAAKTIGAVAVNLGKAALNEAYNLITHPVDTLKRLGSFAKSFSDQIGLTDIVVGAYHGLLSGGCLLIGDLKGAKNHGMQATRALAGAITALGELTGITDLGRAFIALSKGEYGKAALFGALGATQIYLVCSTLGLGNLLSRQGVEAMKKGVRILAKETGREVVEQLEKKISGTVLEQTGLKIAQVSENILVRNWSEIAKNLFVNVKRVVSNTAEKLVEKLMRDNGGKEIVTAATDKLLEKISGSSVKDLIKEFVEEGISAAEAKYMAKCLKKGLWKRGCRSRYHGILAEEITEEITSQVRDNFMERGLKAGFERGWKEAVGRIMKLKGLDKEAGELLLKAGREGFEEGVELGIRKVVKDGVEESFRKYRRNTWFPESNFAGEADEISGGYIIERAKTLEAEQAKKKLKLNKFRRKRPDEEEEIRDIDGNVKHRLKEDIDKKYLEL